MTYSTPVDRQQALATWAIALEAFHQEMHRVLRGGQRDRVRSVALKRALDAARAEVDGLAP
ncbi:hypothetical protein [Acidovorax sp. A1169]|uniref:hypothetical protein n=1 Tax=Acidovorax sp. A1169 TaxID=3059524 RepID=UPI0027377D5D|nr:hypothetical protein [Acidovorax sp. A1169]MDP4076299.1 hypothetical protein [Acidovorax sp. A1169]